MIGLAPQNEVGTEPLSVTVLLIGQQNTSVDVGNGQLLSMPVIW